MMGYTTITGVLNIDSNVDDVYNSNISLRGWKVFHQQ